MEKRALFDQLKPGYYLDAYCNRSGEWMVARVLSVRQNEALINFQGWSSRFNQEFRLPSRKLAFLHQFTGPYTGAKTANQKGQPSQEDLPEQLALLRKLAESRCLLPELADPYFVNQRIRGAQLNNLDLHFCQLAKPKRASELLTALMRYFSALLCSLPALLPDYCQATQPHHAPSALIASLVETAYQARTVLGLNPLISKISISGMDFKTQPFKGDKFVNQPYI